MEKIKKLLAGKGDNYIFPFFWLHGETENVLRRYMKIIYNSNIRAVCVESRPHPDFCGEKWWKDMNVILEEAERLGMKVWILDDSHFPTGFANGAMEKQPDKLCRQSICCKTYDITGQKKLHIPAEELRHPIPFEKTPLDEHVMQEPVRAFEDDRLLGLVAIKWADVSNGKRLEKKMLCENLIPFVREEGLDWEAPEGKWRVFALHLSRNYGYHRSYVNMMSRPSCKVLLDAVYEPHYMHYGRYFGNTIEGFFSDEPELGNGHIYDIHNIFGTEQADYPWSDELEQKLAEKFGDGLAGMLALLWETEGDACLTARVRYTYMDAVTRLVRENFSFQIAEWCHEHDVKYIGHMIEDDNHHSRTGSSLGHYFRGLQGQDMAGIDDIGGQVFPQGEDICYDEGVFHHRDGSFYHYGLGKLGSSAAVIEPNKKGNTMCEIFGNYGWEEGVRLEKYLADHFLVRGVNHYVPHAFSAKEFPDTDCPPHFYAHGHNPQYRHFGYLMSYMNRVCELISGGCHNAPVAVLYTGEGDWTGNYMPGDRVGHILADRQIDYDYIPQDVFEDREVYGTEIISQRLQGAGLRVNKQVYKAVVVPYMQFVTASLVNAVTELHTAGVPVLFINALPEGICGTTFLEFQEDVLLSGLYGKAEVITLSELAARLDKEVVPEIKLQPENDRIRYLHYCHTDGCHVWIFVNEGTKIYRGKVWFRQFAADTRKDRKFYLYNAWDNRIEPADMDAGEGYFKLEIAPLESKILVADLEKMESKYLPWQKKAGVEKISFDGIWKRRLCRSIDYPDFGKIKEVTIPDRLAEEEPGFSGYVRYENCFSARQGDSVWLEITDAYEGVEVFVNGISLGIQIVPVYRFDLTEVIKDGKNKLCIEVATTLEREMFQPSGSAMMPKQKPKNPSGINGKVYLCKSVDPDGKR